jgi:N-carbamoylputrescine amidase
MSADDARDVEMPHRSYLRCNLVRSGCVSYAKWCDASRSTCMFSASTDSLNGFAMKTFVVLLLCSWSLIGSAAPTVRDLNVAVVQFESVDGDIAGNLKTAERWLDQAVSAGAQLILYPEFMPVGYHLGPAIWDSGETMTGPTVSWLKQQSAKHNVWIGTSFLEAEGEHFYNAFVLTNPKGEVAGKVRKEVPASAETYFFKGEVNDHVIDTELGRIGIMICYENYLTRIANKVAAANVDLLLSPYSFPGIPGGTGPQPLTGSEYAGVFAAALGIPVAAANKVGKWRSPMPGYPGYIVNGEFPGLSAIARADGSIAAKADRNAGFVVAKVRLDPAVKKSNVTFNGTFVSGLVGNVIVTDVPRYAADEVGVASYVKDENRRAKALDVSASGKE